MENHKPQPNDTIKQQLFNIETAAKNNITLCWVAAGIITGLYLLCTLAGCKKADVSPASVTNKVSVIFYSDNLGASVSNYTLLVDGQTVGPVNYSQAAPGCGAPGFIELTLAPGQHKIEVSAKTGTANTITTVSFSYQPDCIAYNIHI